MADESRGGRAAAAAVLCEITEKAAYANDALRKDFAANPRMDAREKAFATELVNGALRNMIRLDHIVGAFSSAPIEKMQPFILNLLRISVYQIRFMDRVPESAAVNEAVKLAKEAGFEGLSGFVNGLLRNVIREPGKPAFPTKPEVSSSGDSPPHMKADEFGRAEKLLSYYISLNYSFPKWLADSLISWLGRERALKFCEGSAEPPRVAVFANTLLTTAETLAKRLGSEGVDCVPGRIHPECLSLRKTSDITRLDSFREGLFFVIDENAVTAAKALGCGRGETVADICAAPGGKAFTLACLTGCGAKIFAYDVKPHRIKLMEDGIKRLKLTNINAAVCDMAAARVNAGGFADRVLLDAPCSGFGTIRKRPEIKYARGDSDIRELVAKQRALLASAAACLKKGGTLVYCTCTVAREENIGNVRWFLKKFPFESAPIDHGTDGETSFVEESCLQILPDSGGDAFFIARMTKKDE